MTPKPNSKRPKIINEAISTEITKAVVDAIVPNGKEYLVSDSSVIGFGVRVRASGSMSYVVNYRVGSGRAGDSQKFTIAKVGKITPDQARQIAKEVLAEVVRGGDPASEKRNDRKAITFAELVEIYIESNAKEKESTKYLYGHWLRSFAVPKLGRIKAKAVTASDIESIHSELKNKRITANRVLSTISSMYNWAIDKEHVPLVKNPASKVKKYREDSRERYLSDEELGRLADAILEAETVGIQWNPDATKKVKHAPKPENRRRTIDSACAAAIRLFILTGARKGEILKLKWTDVDWQRGLLLLGDSKTGKKSIILNSFALEILRGLPRTSKFVIPGTPIIRADGGVEDRPRSDLKRPWALVRSRAGLDAEVGDDILRVRIHDLRHTHASMGVEENLSLHIIGKLLGHTQAKTTARYAHLADNPKKRASELIGARLNVAMTASKGGASS